MNLFTDRIRENREYGEIISNLRRTEKRPKPLPLIVTGLCGYNGEISVTPEGIFVLLYLVFVSSVGVTLWSTLLKHYPIGNTNVTDFI